MHVGVILDACSCGILMLPSVAERLGFKPGDYFQIENEDRDTVIVRSLLPCHTRIGEAVMRENYVYLDTQSAYYLIADVHEIVRVRPAQYPVDCP